MKKFIQVKVEVPKSDYCWDGNTSCRYFDNEGGHPRCEILNVLGGCDYLEYNKDDKVQKLPNCLNAKSES